MLSIQNQSSSSSSSCIYCKDNNKKGLAGCNQLDCSAKFHISCGLRNNALYLIIDHQNHTYTIEKYISLSKSWQNIHKKMIYCHQHEPNISNINEVITKPKITSTTSLFQFKDNHHIQSPLKNKNEKIIKKPSASGKKEKEELQKQKNRFKLKKSSSNENNIKFDLQIGTNHHQKKKNVNQI